MTNTKIPGASRIHSAERRPSEHGGEAAARTGTKILMIDNYDSFTYNLVQYLGELGADVHVHRNDAITLDEIAAHRPDGLVISPGPCTPKEAGVSVPAIERFAGAIPILGVCLGHQAIGAALGGQIVRAPRIMHGKTSPMRHDGRGVFRGLSNPFDATRYHSLVIERDTLPPELEVSAWTEEGEIMGVRHRSLPIEGVQFHPESILTLEGKRLLQNFLDGLPAR
jgi:anthranilate synthase/aminodeoxychorismate synthase-like glutamine amidotransferase